MPSELWFPSSVHLNGGSLLVWKPTKHPRQQREEILKFLKLWLFSLAFLGLGLKKEWWCQNTARASVVAVCLAEPEAGNSCESLSHEIASQLWTMLLWAWGGNGVERSIWSRVKWFTRGVTEYACTRVMVLFWTWASSEYAKQNLRHPPPSSGGGSREKSLHGLNAALPELVCFGALPLGFPLVWRGPNSASWL